MILTLEVIGEPAGRLGADRRKVFNAIGGTIGRLPDNDWVFPDPYISGRHALIRYLNGRFFVEDTSTNGVFINSPGFRISKTEAQALRHGDVLYIDAYEIAVIIESDGAADHSDANDPLALLRAHADRRGLTPDEADTEEDASATEWLGTTESGPSQPESTAPAADAVTAAPEHDVVMELSDHRAAAQTAARRAFQAMLAQFDPQRLQAEFDRQLKKGSLLGMPARLRYWDLYRDKFAEMVKNADGTFGALIGNEFEKACQEQIEQLKARSAGKQ